MYLKSLEIQNWTVLKEVSLNLENQGMVAIQGTNGSGKSSIWDALDFLLWGSCSKPVRSAPEDAFVRLSFSHEGHDFLFTLEKKRLSILKDGVDVTPKNLAGKRNDRTGILNILSPIDQVHWHNLVFLSQDTFHVLVDGTPSMIKSWVSGMFGIYRLEDILENTDKALSRVSPDYKAYKEVETYLSQTGDSLQDSLAFLELRRDGLQDLVSQALDLWELQRDWRRYEMDDSHEILKSLSDRLETLPKPLVDEGKLVRLESSYTQIQDATQGYTPSYSMEESQKILKGVANLKYLLRTIESYRGKLSNLPEVEEVNLDFLEKSILKMTSKAGVLKDKIEAVGNSNSCPICGGPLETDGHSMVDRWKESLKKTEAVLSSLKAQKDEGVKANKILEKRRSYGETLQDHERQLSSLKADLGIDFQTEEELSHIEAQAQRDDKYWQGISLLNSLGFESLPSLEDISLWKEYYRVQREIKAIRPIPKPDKELGKLEMALIESKDSLESSLIATKVDIREIEKEIERIEEKKREMESLLPAVVKYQTWNRTKEVTQDLISRASKETLESLVDRLKVYLDFFGMDKEFYVHETARGLEVRWGDSWTPKHLSGGEKQRLSLSALFALHDIAPSRYKTNLLVLDEVDRGLDSFGRKSLSDLLNYKKDSIESLFVISHSDLADMADWDHSYVLDHGTLVSL